MKAVGRIGSVGGALLLSLVLAGPLLAATPGSGSVGPSDPTLSWRGKHFLAGSVANPSLCPEGADKDILCDHFDLRAAVSGSYWDSHDGRFTVTISWGSASDNFDLYAYRQGGAMVAKSARSGTRSESVSVAHPSGTYTILRFSADRWMPTHVPAVGESGRMSTATSKISPLITRTSLLCACGAV